MNFKLIVAAGTIGLLLIGSPIAVVAGSAGNKETPIAAGALDVTVYRSPSCKCCGKWLDHMKQQGFRINDVLSDDMDAVKAKLGVPAKLASCHTAVVGGYLVEGHVPAGDVKKLLADKPAVAGIGVPGMVAGTPGMEMGDKKEPFTVLSFDKAGNSARFSEYVDY